jgi:formylglycine-generating enzyme required for sulfatase activity
MRPIRPLLASLTLLASLFLAASPASAQAPASPCAADSSGDGVVDAGDLGEVLGAWGSCGGCRADIDGSGTVGGEDLAAVLNFWGTGCPRITGISPVAGPPSGGNTVTITGTRLDGVTEVWIGDQQANKVVPVDENTVTAIVPPSQPAGSTGPRLVRLVTDSGESGLVSGYTYVLSDSVAPPSIASVSPQAIPASGGATVTITGANFLDATEVLFDGVSVTFSLTGATQILAYPPAHAKGGMFDVAVTTPGGTSTSVGAIAYWQAPSWPCTVLEASPDPAVVYDAALRTAILRTGFPWRITESAVGIEMVLIPNGTYEMGCSASNDHNCKSDESPIHSVTLTKAFYLGRYEVMQKEWQRRTGSNPSYFQGPAQSNWFYKGLQVPPYWDETQAPSCPVENISWNDIVNEFQPGTGLRLPTEAEWEYAYRAGTRTAFHGWPAQPGGTNDDADLGEIAWFGGCSSSPFSCGNSGYHTNAVGQKAANGYGLHDMSGNVAEYYADCWDDNYYQQSPSVDPPGTCCTCGINDSQRSWRGGGYNEDSDPTRASYRYGHHGNDTKSTNVGFRVARTAS